MALSSIWWHSAAAGQQRLQSPPADFPAPFPRATLLQLHAALLMPRPLAHRNLTPNVACLLRMSDAALRRGAAWGGLTAFSLGVHALCVVYRGSRVWGVDGAAAAAAASAVGACERAAGAGAAILLLCSVHAWMPAKPLRWPPCRTCNISSEDCSSGAPPVPSHPSPPPQCTTSLCPPAPGHCNRRWRTI